MTTQPAPTKDRTTTITITASILIDRSQEDVFAFACDYRNDPQWRSGVADMRLEPGTGITTGHHTHEIMKVLGRITTTEAEITCGCPKLCRGWSCGVSVFVDEPVASGGSDDSKLL